MVFEKLKFGAHRRTDDKFPAKLDIFVNLILIYALLSMSNDMSIKHQLQTIMNCMHQLDEENVRTRVANQ